MAYEPEIVAKPDHLLVLSHGEFDVEGGSRLFGDLLVAVRETGLSRIVVDNHGLERRVAATEKALLGFSVEGPYLNHLAAGGPPIRMAFLVPQNWLLPFRPLADHLNSIGLDTETFSDPDAMSEWLGVSQV